MSLETSSTLSAPGRIGFLALCGFLPLAAVLLELPSASAQAPPEQPSPSGALFLRGDSNADGEVDLSDAIHTLGWLFLGGPRLVCDDAADTNDDQRLGLTDAVYTLTFVFLGGAVPPPPGPEACGPDPSEDALGCGSYAPCEVSQFLMGLEAPVCKVFGTDCEGTSCSATVPELLANGNFDANTCCWCFVVDEESLPGIIIGFASGGSPCPTRAQIFYDDSSGPHTAEAHYEQDFAVLGPLFTADLSFRYNVSIFGRSSNGGGRTTEGTHKLRALITKLEGEPPVETVETEVFSVTITGIPTPFRQTVGPIDLVDTNNPAITTPGKYRLKLSLRVEGADNWRSSLGLDRVSLITDADPPKNLIEAEAKQAPRAFTEVEPGSENNEILKVEFTVVGSTGHMNLQSVRVTPNNTVNDDVTAVKVFFNGDADDFAGAIDITSGGPYTFPKGADPTVLVNVVLPSGNVVDLPSGSSFIWITYDIDAAATIGNTVDAVLDAGSIVTGDDQIWPFCQLHPFGERTIKKTGGSFCGDGNCDPGEDPCNCPGDCGVPPATETNCSDNVDNDCDGLIDCDDGDCADDPACPSCGDGNCELGEDPCNCPGDCGAPPATETNCSNNVDDDCDGLTDCDDGDCASDPACPPCASAGEPCGSDAECCSNKCRGRSGAKTCK